MNKNFLFFFQSASVFTLCMIRKCDRSTYSLTLTVITVALMVLGFLCA
ncbi:MAG: hypothetical protein AB1847_11695 [bacterium]